MRKQGFSIIELLIVIAIISILLGVAVPYYNDYIYDARLNVLKQNVATFRNSVNQFRGDNVRGPFAVEVRKGGSVIHSDPLSNAADGSELVSGPIQMIGNPSVPTRRANIVYLQTAPVFIDPQSGISVPTANITVASPSAYFYDNDANGAFDFDPNNDDDYSDSEFAFIDGNNNGTYESEFDTILFFDTQSIYTPFPPDAATSKALDFTSFSVRDSAGLTY